jgi:putative membrane protein
MDRGAEQDPRVYFAAERTFLAWIRTGLGLIGIGFAVSRFGLLFHQLSQTESHLPARATGPSVWVSWSFSLLSCGIFNSFTR